MAESVTLPPPPAPTRHLLFKGIAGALLGFPLALWLSWLLYYGGRDLPLGPARDQVAMWTVVPLWCSVIALSFLAGSRGRCLVGLALANLAAASLWGVLR